MMAHQHKQPTPIKELASEVPDDLVAIVERLMQKAPAARYGSTAEVMEALQSAGAIPTTPARAPRPPQPRPDRTPTPTMVGGQVPGRSPTRTFGPPPAPTRTSTPPPPTRTQMGINLPNRQTMQGMPAPGGPPVPGPRPVPAAARVPQVPPAAGKQSGTWEERLGPIGIAICAVLACILAWFLTYRLF
jgi:serine/threonine-protein kinase